MSSKRIPMVGYLDLEGDGAPRLVGNRCSACGAIFFDRRNACAKCGGDPGGFERTPLQREGTLLTYTIVHRAAPNVPVPYVSAVVELDCGGVIKANLHETVTDPSGIPLGGRVRLVTFDAGRDDDGTTAVGFGFAPVGARMEGGSA
jgi:uncharacterized OB-fold protein